MCSKKQQALEVAQEAELCERCTKDLVGCYMERYHESISSFRFCDPCWVNWKLYCIAIQFEAKQNGL